MPRDNLGVPSSSKEIFLFQVSSRLLHDNGDGPTSAGGIWYEVDKEGRDKSRTHRIPVTLRNVFECWSAKLDRHR